MGLQVLDGGRTVLAGAALLVQQILQSIAVSCLQHLVGDQSVLIAYVVGAPAVSGDGAGSNSAYLIQSTVAGGGHHNAGGHQLRLGQSLQGPAAVLVAGLGGILLGKLTELLEVEIVVVVGDLVIVLAVDAGEGPAGLGGLVCAHVAALFGAIVLRDLTALAAVLAAGGIPAVVAAGGKRGHQHQHSQHQRQGALHCLVHVDRRPFFC